MFFVGSRTISVICAGLAQMMKHLTEARIGNSSAAERLGRQEGPT